MPYLHLPVQSGSDRVLAAMNRRHDAKAYLRIIEKVRKARPDIALSSDFIVGFPGETEEDFEATLDLVRKVDFASSFSFKYSARPGTPSAQWQVQIAGRSEDRAPLHPCKRLLEEQRQAFNQAMVGRRRRGAVREARAARRPDRRQVALSATVHVEHREAAIGDLCSVRDHLSGAEQPRGSPCRGEGRRMSMQDNTLAQKPRRRVPAEARAGDGTEVKVAFDDNRHREPRLRAVR